MRINTNNAAMNTYSRLSAANTSKTNSLAKLSSGLRINKAGDDAAGLAISEKMKSQIGGLKQAKSNAQDGISLIQTAEGALNETHSILGRMRDLAVQGSNDTLTNDDREQLNKEFSALSDEITRISGTTEFNTKKLLKGDADDSTKAASFKFQIGANAGQNIEVKIKDMSATGLGVDGDTTAADGTKTDGNFKLNATSDLVKAVSDAQGEVDKLTSSSTATEIKTANDGLAQAQKAANDNGIENSQKAIKAIDKAVKQVSDQRSDLGAAQNRMEHTINNLTSSNENLSEANSRIRDVDMAEEMMSFTKSNILSQAATSMLAQANSMPNSVLSLLQG
ncbi:flagellin N-terminal helical domain-containing protein [Enterococcus bulliens]